MIIEIQNGFEFGGEFQTISPIKCLACCVLGEAGWLLLVPRLSQGREEGGAG